MLNIRFMSTFLTCYCMSLGRGCACLPFYSHGSYPQLCSCWSMWFPVLGCASMSAGGLFIACSRTHTHTHTNTHTCVGGHLESPKDVGFYGAMKRNSVQPKMCIDNDTWKPWSTHWLGLGTLPEKALLSCASLAGSQLQRRLASSMLPTLRATRPRELLTLIWHNLVSASFWRAGF